MKYKIENCKDGDAEYIIDRLVEYNLSQVPAQQEVLFDTLDKKITDDNGKIIAGCVAKMYCWNVAYIDTLWVGSEYRGQGLAGRLYNYSCSQLKSEGKRIFSVYYPESARALHHKMGFVDICECGKLYLNI